MNFLELVKARYSARKYANRPVEAEKLDYIMECVRFAPSAVNFQRKHSASCVFFSPLFLPTFVASL